MKKKNEDSTLPFYKIPQKVLDQAVMNLKQYCGNSGRSFDHDMVVTAFKAQIGSGSPVAAPPRIVWFNNKPTFRISLEGEKLPAFASMEQLQSKFQAAL